MAKGIKTGGRDFKKGQSGNVNGRPKTDPEVRKLRQYNKQEIERLLNEFMNTSLHDLIKLLQDGSRPVIELMIAKVVSEAIKRGDHMRLGFVLDRMVGKVVDRVDAKIQTTLEDLVAGPADPE